MLNDSMAAEISGTGSPDARQEQRFNVFVSVNDAGCVGELFGRQRIGDGDRGHPGLARRRHAHSGIFDHTTNRWIHAEQFGCAQENIGRGLGLRDIGHADNRLEEPVQTAHRQDLVDHRMRRTGCQGQGIADGELFDKIREVIEDGLIAAEQIDEARAFAIHQFVERLRRLMSGDEITPERLVGASIITGEMNAVPVGVTEFIEHVEERLFMKWFAVDDDTVHVEHHRPAGSEGTGDRGGAGV
jgi:hypothetical protein